MIDLNLLHLWSIITFFYFIRTVFQLRPKLNTCTSSQAFLEYLFGLNYICYHKIRNTSYRSVTASCLALLCKLEWQCSFVGLGFCCYFYYVKRFWTIGNQCSINIVYYYYYNKSKRILNVLHPGLYAFWWIKTQSVWTSLLSLQSAASTLSLILCFLQLVIQWKTSFIWHLMYTRRPVMFCVV